MVNKRKRRTEEMNTIHVTATNANKRSFSRTKKDEAITRSRVAEENLHSHYEKEREKKVSSILVIFHRYEHKDDLRREIKTCTR